MQPVVKALVEAFRGAAGWLFGCKSRCLSQDLQASINPHKKCSPTRQAVAAIQDFLGGGGYRGVDKGLNTVIFTQNSPSPYTHEHMGRKGCPSTHSRACIHTKLKLSQALCAAGKFIFGFRTSRGLCFVTSGCVHLCSVVGTTAALVWRPSVCLAGVDGAKRKVTSHLHPGIW